MQSPIASHWRDEICRHRKQCETFEGSIETWRELGNLLTWQTKPTETFAGTNVGNARWYSDGTLNACANAVDRWAAVEPGRIALLHESDNSSCTVSYQELLESVCRIANLFTRLEIGVGDVVTLYLPTSPIVVYCMLACARIGAVHSVVFGGLSAASLHARLCASKSRLLVTANGMFRGGRPLPLRERSIEALEMGNSFVGRLLTVGMAPSDSAPVPELDLQSEMKKERPYCSPVWVSSEHPLFLLYTSGSTGAPKGLLHCTAGYLVYAAASTRFIFDLRGDDRFGCCADVGWITGHTYAVYGPLLNGCATLLFESTPMFPTASRLWEAVGRFRLTHLYTAPTVIRMLRKEGDHWLSPLEKVDSLRVLGSVGEPIGEDAWLWFFEKVGKGRCHLLDTFWQSETGGIVIAGYAGLSKMHPGCAGEPFLGQLPALTVVDRSEGDERGELVLARCWPGVARSVWGNHSRYEETYLGADGSFVTGDSALRITQPDGSVVWKILGRHDDVMNVSGHRLSTAEIEAAIGAEGFVAESAVVAAADAITGCRVIAFVVVKEKTSLGSTAIADCLGRRVRAAIGSFAVPRDVFVVSDLPKTRSGKIIRRLLRALAQGERYTGDLSTLANES